jgi:hypothetical protein
LILAKYFTLPTAPTGSQKAPVFICPAYAKLNSALDKPVYFVADIENAVRSPHRSLTRFALRCDRGPADETVRDQRTC